MTTHEYPNHPHNTYDGRVYDGSNHLRPKYDPILTPLKNELECKTQGHLWGVKPMHTPPGSPISSITVPCVFICCRCEKVDADRYNKFASVNNLPLYSADHDQVSETNKKPFQNLISKIKRFLVRGRLG